MLLSQAPHLMRDRKNGAAGGGSIGGGVVAPPMVTKACAKSLVGTEMVDWLLALSSTTPLHVHSRQQVAVACTITSSS